MANIDLLERVLKQIQADPEHWNQFSWRDDGNQDPPYVFMKATFACDPALESQTDAVLPVSCDTAFCFAGWKCQMDDREPRWAGSGCLHANEDDHADMLRPVVRPSQRAARLLGLDARQALYLFDAERTLSDIEAFIENIKRGGPGTPDEEAQTARDRQRAWGLGSGLRHGNEHRDHPEEQAQR